MTFYRSFDIIELRKTIKGACHLMNNYTKIINQMKEKIENFSKEISKDLSLQIVNLY